VRIFLNERNIVVGGAIEKENIGKSPNPKTYSVNLSISNPEFKN